MIVNKIVWGAIRRRADDGREFTLASEAGDGPDTVRGLVSLNRDVIPQWHAANPLVRVARFRMTELTD